MYGLIGFFDILGYQNLLENNLVSELVEEILETINTMPEEVIKIFIEEREGASERQILGKEMGLALKHLVFSDTIVFTLAYPGPDESNKEWNRLARKFMSINSSSLTARMFRSGLPTRGVLHEGDFVTKGMCIAGKGMVEAYQLCESLNLSGIVCTQFLGNKIIEDQTIKKINNDSFYNFTYLTPKKDGSEIKLLHGNWVQFLGIDALLECQNDVESFVLKSFWAHQKDCATSVDIKVRNTTKVVRKMLHNIRLDASIPKANLSNET